MDFVTGSYSPDLDESEKEAIRSGITILANALQRLPRVTREFLAMLIERREPSQGRRKPHAAVPWVSLPIIERTYRGGDLKGELDILDASGLISIDAEDAGEWGPPEVYVWLSRNEDLRNTFTEFLDAKKLDVRSVVGKVDFSAF